MFARVSTIQGTPERVQDGIRQVQEQVLPALQKLAGSKGAYLLVDRKSGKFLSITLWETLKALEASSAAGDRLRAQASQSVAAQKPPVVDIYEVAVQPNK